MNRFLVQIFVLTTFATLLQASCRGRTSVVRNGKEYRIFLERLTNEEAAGACKKWGKTWRSPSPSSLVQNIHEPLHTCLKEMIEASQSDSRTSETDTALHLGGVMRNGWFWNNGERIPNMNENKGFQKWAANQPQSPKFLGRNRCLVASMWKKTGVEIGDWIDEDCNSQMFYACERDVDEDLIWGYENNENSVTPENWHTLPGNEACSSTRQSPQDIFSPQLSSCQEEEVIAPVGWKTENGASVRWEIRNTGRLIEIRFNPPRTLYTSFGPNGTKHYVDYVHLKWGPTYNTGSEHTVGGLRHAGELQIFHYPNDQGERHAIAFLLQQRGFFDNTNWDPLLRHVITVTTAHSFAQMPSLPGQFMTLLKDPARSSFNLKKITKVGVRYEGSLPHPPCTQNVVWSVYTTPIQLSSRQFSVFRLINMEGLENGTPRRIQQTTRPIQPSTSPLCLLR